MDACSGDNSASARHAVDDTGVVLGLGFKASGEGFSELWDNTCGFAFVRFWGLFALQHVEHMLFLGDFQGVTQIVCEPVGSYTFAE